MQPMTSRATVRQIATVLLGAMLFAQAALAVAACDWLRVAPAQAIMAKATEPSCHEVPAENANLCLAHCLGNDQSADTPQVTIPVGSPAVLSVVGIQRVLVPHAMLPFTLPHPGAPPPRILFHSFLI